MYKIIIFKFDIWKSKSNPKNRKLVHKIKINTKNRCKNQKIKTGNQILLETGTVIFHFDFKS